MALPEPFAWLMNLRFAKGGRYNFLPNIHKCKRGGLCKTNVAAQIRTYVPIMTLRRGGIGKWHLAQTAHEHCRNYTYVFLEFLQHH